MSDSWTPFEGSVGQILEQYPQPLEALASRRTPAVVLRQIFDPQHCAGLMERFTQHGYFNRDAVGVESQLSGGPYLDLGTSLGRVGADPDAFFAHAARTRELFRTLFDGFDDPVQLVYQTLAALVPGKKVLTARQSDGRLYGPAIFRIYQGQEGHRAHFDSVAKRANLPHYAVSHFDHQFAGILCLQSAGDSTQSGEPIIYRCAHDPDWGADRMEAFGDYAAARGIPQSQVQLDPGDLYFFYTENIHEVPQVTRDRARVVLAIFIAMSPDREEVFVWS